MGWLGRHTGGSRRAEARPDAPLNADADVAERSVDNFGHIQLRIATAREAAEAAASRPSLRVQLINAGVAESIEDGITAGAVAYIEELLAALEGGFISTEETATLRELVVAHGLGLAGMMKCHYELVLALAHAALDDGRVSQTERSELKGIASTLGLPASIVPTLIAEADAARDARLSAGLLTLPTSWPHGAPLRVGHKVAFTGFVSSLDERDQLERRSQELGVRVMSSVSGRTAMLVTDGSFSGTKAARAAELGTRVVDGATYEQLLRHLQPAV